MSKSPRTAATRAKPKAKSKSTPKGAGKAAAKPRRGRATGRRGRTAGGAGSLVARLRGHPLVLAVLALLLIAGGVAVGLALKAPGVAPSTAQAPMPPPAYTEADLQRLQEVVRAAEQAADHADTDVYVPEGVRLSDAPATSGEPPRVASPDLAPAAPPSPTAKPKVAAAPASPAAPKPATAAAVQPPDLAALPANPGMPAWLRFAVPPPAFKGRALVAVVIDDMGIDRKRTARITALPGPITASFLTYAPDGQTQARAARAAGHELMIHMPMEPSGRSTDPGPGALRVGQTRAEIVSRLEDGLSRYQGYVGINNHMGSRFTENADGMRPVMEVLKARGLLWLDSRTSPKSVGGAVARQVGLPYAERSVFLDHEEDLPHVLGQLTKLEDAARRTGFAVAIGHPKDNTIEGLSRWLPTLERKGLVLVPLSTIVRVTQSHSG